MSNKHIPEPKDDISQITHNNSGVGYHNIMDIAINAAMVNVLKGKPLNISPKAAGYIILFASVSEIKQFVKWILDKVRENGCHYCEIILKYIKDIGIYECIIKIIKTIKYIIFLRFLSNRKENHPKQIKNIITETDKYSKKSSLIIGSNHQVIDAILKYIDNNPTLGSYDSKIITTNVINLHDRVDTVLIYNICIIIDQIKVYFNTDLMTEYTSYHTNNTSNLSILNKVYIKHNNIILNNTILEENIGITSLTQLIDNQAVCKILKKYSKEIDGLTQTKNYITFIDKPQNSTVIQKNDQNVSMQSIIISLKHLYPSNYNPSFEHILMCELIILFYYADYDVRFTKDKIYFDTLNFSINLNNNISNDMLWDSSGCTMSTEIKSKFKHRHEKLLQYLDLTNDFKLLKQSQEDKIPKIITDVTIDLDIMSNINDKYMSKNIDLIKKWNDYLYDHIIKSYQDTSIAENNVTIYSLKLSEHVEEKDIPNPDFTAYLQKKEMYESMIKTKSSKDSNTDTDTDIDTEDTKRPSNNIIFNMGLHKVPPQTIKEKKIVYTIISTKEGTVCKRLDTLYLRKADSRKLHAILKNFSEFSKMYDELCIIKKLGILLHGDPGTGKSSAIMAIATFLNYDIYYVSLNGVDKNFKLKMIFDYVAKNCSKKGIYVFEDIDAQTNIVHQRTTIIKSADKLSVNSESIDESVSSVYQSENKKNDDLDLSYLFNILDGTLSQQDMVYIMTTNHLERLDKGFYRKGRFHAIIELKKCDRYQIQSIFEKIMKRSIDSDVLNKISEDTFTPAEVIHHLLENCHNDELSDKEIIDDLINSHDDFIEYIQKSSQQIGLFAHKIKKEEIHNLFDSDSDSDNKKKVDKQVEKSK